MPPGFTWKFLPTSLDATDECFDDMAYVAGKGCAADLCQAAGFGSQDCFGYECRGGYYDNGHCQAGDVTLFTYEKHNKYQYLYQTFPQTISPLVGVNSEHFAVWMKTAALPTFRKLYGRITQDLKRGDTLVFTIENNYDVHAFSGKKALVVATTVGFEIEFIALAYTTRATQGGGTLSRLNLGVG